MTLEIEGHAVAVEVKDVESAEAILQLAERYYNGHPQKVTTQSGVKVTARHNYAVG